MSISFSLRCRRPRLFLAAAALIVQHTAGAASDALGNMTLAELMDEPVTSVSKKTTKLSDSAAAITVITQSDIRRLGITSLPDALRLVPGIDVARISSNAWAVSARGSNGKFANKLLVLVDGRTVYAPGSAGVFWNAQDLMLEDIERIEVIRGPGATLWGSNAVNGVVNISTQQAADTQGALISASRSSEPGSQWAGRYGGRLGADLSYRVYAKYLDQAGLDESTHMTHSGGWHTSRGGFRLDWNGSSVDAVTLQGDAYDGRAFTAIKAVSLTPPSVVAEVVGTDNSGQNLLTRWTHAFTKESELTLQAYVDHSIQGDGSGVEYRTTYDFALQHRFQWSLHDIVWGTGYRVSHVDEISESFNLSWSPPNHDISLFNIFAQDDLNLIPGTLRATLGAKFEASSLVGNCVEPTLRMLWTPVEHQVLWAAVSQATRRPSLYELGGRANAAAFQPSPDAPPILVAALPNPGLRSEEVLAYELGYRYTPVDRFAIDVTSYVNHYTHLISNIPLPTSFEAVPAPPHVLLAVMQENVGGTHSYGAEATLHFQAAASWQLTASFDWEQIDRLQYPKLGEGTPSSQVKLRSYLDLPHAVELNASLSYVSSFSVSTGDGTTVIPAYVRADLGLLWHPSAGLSLGLWGVNLLQREHLEFVSFDTSLQNEIPRSVLGKVTWSF